MTEVRAKKGSLKGLICTIDGCDQPMHSRQMCKRHYKQWHASGAAKPGIKGKHGTTEERFWHFVVKGAPDECWLWTGNTDKDGYGSIRTPETQLRAQVRLRTMQKNLAHASLVADSIDCGVASADFLLLFRKKGKNPIPVQHPVGMLEYAGDRKPPADILSYRGHTGKQTENRFSHWIWRQYADCMWDDIRMGRVLPFREARASEDEKHVHCLQLDVIDRCVILRSNPGETVLTPFMGVGSEVYSPVLLGRKGIGFELKPSYFRQAVKNVQLAAAGRKDVVENLTIDFGGESDEASESE